MSEARSVFERGGYQMEEKSEERNWKARREEKACI